MSEIAKEVIPISIEQELVKSINMLKAASSYRISLWVIANEFEGMCL